MSDNKDDAQNLRLNTAAVMAHWALHLIDKGFAPAVVVGFKPGDDYRTDVVVIAPDEPLGEVAFILGKAFAKVCQEVKEQIEKQAGGDDVGPGDSPKK